MFHYQSDNNLYCEATSLVQLAKIYQTPLYVYSQQSIIANYQTFHQAFKTQAHLICYAVKANANLAILHLLAKAGAGFDIVSAGELARVIAAGGDPKRCVFSGIGKTKAEINTALNHNILCFNIESKSELLRIATVAKSLNKIAPISLRINPDINANTHPYITTGLKDNKFGVDSTEALDLYLTAEQLHHIQIRGIACHIGSQINEIAPFLAALERLLALVAKLKAKGIILKHIDLGGGVGIAYGQNDTTLNINDYINQILKRTQDYQIILEPGRAIIGNSGVFLTKVEYLKQNKTQSFAIVDGAMNDLLRPALYQAYHQILPLKRNQNGKKINWHIVGPVCESADFLAKNRTLALNEGDILALMCSGAYGFVMSSNYNSRPRAAEVLVNGNRHRLIRRRENIAQLFALENI